MFILLLNEHVGLDNVLVEDVDEVSSAFEVERNNESEDLREYSLESSSSGVLTRPTPGDDVGKSLGHGEKIIIIHRDKQDGRH